MKALADAIYDRLVADSTLMALIPTYQGAPAIFDMTQLPNGHPLTWIELSRNPIDNPFDTKVSFGRALTREIGIYVPRTGDTTTIDTIAERVRTLVHRYKFAFGGMQTLIASASGPVTAPTDDTFYGRIVTLAITAI